MWHCPHCGAPQAETARCWVCRRSSTTCSTCRHFRRAVSADLGYCALDARRQPLTGLEIRGCWELGVGAADPEAPPAVEAHRLRAARTPWPATPPGSTDAVVARGFVPIELLGRLPDAIDPLPHFVIPDPDEDWSERTSLFGDGER